MVYAADTTTLCGLVAVWLSVEPMDAVNVAVAAVVGVPDNTNVFPTMESASPAGSAPDETPVPPVSE